MKIALIGYGKMGKMIEQIAISRGHEIVSIIDIDNQQDFESEAFKSADVAIEFTAPQAAYGNYLKAWAAGVKRVCTAGSPPPPLHSGWASPRFSPSRNGTEAGRVAAATCTTCCHSAAKECGKAPGTPAFSGTLSDSLPGTRRK
jgi:4-hydroxy-tetrahydrodipicolinate reductase